MGTHWTTFEFCTNGFTDCSADSFTNLPADYITNVATDRSSDRSTYSRAYFYAFEPPVCSSITGTDTRTNGKDGWPNVNRNDCRWIIKV